MRRQCKPRKILGFVWTGCWCKTPFWNHFSLELYCRCWLSTDHGFFWAFVGPVILIITVGKHNHFQSAMIYSVFKLYCVFYWKIHRCTILQFFVLFCFCFFYIYTFSFVYKLFTLHLNNASSIHPYIPHAPSYSILHTPHYSSARFLGCLPRLW